MTLVVSSVHIKKSGLWATRPQPRWWRLAIQFHTSHNLIKHAPSSQALASPTA